MGRNRTSSKNPVLGPGLYGIYKGGMKWVRGDVEADLPGGKGLINVKVETQVLLLNARIGTDRHMIPPWPYLVDKRDKQHIAGFQFF